MDGGVVVQPTERLLAGLENVVSMELRGMKPVLVSWRSLLGARFVARSVSS